jgi:hypothetical protein
VTRQARDFNADLDFDRFGMTGFLEAVVFKIARRMSSSFRGLSEIGLAFAIIHDLSPHFPTSIDNTQQDFL